MDQLVRQKYRLTSSDPVRLQQQRPAKQFQIEEPVDNNVNFKSTHASDNNNLIDSSPQDRLVTDDEDVDTNNLVVESSASSTTNDVNNIERLTVLEAPSVAIDSRSSLSRASSFNNNISNRETNLLSSASPATGTQSTPNIQYPPSQQRPNDNPNIYNTDILAAGQRNQTSPDESSHPTTFLGFSTILIIILGLIILYNWLLQRRKGGGRQKWTIVDFWPISLLPSEYILSKGNLKFRYNSNKQTVSKRATSKDNELDSMATLGSRGEHVQLVNRRPLGACEGQSRTDDIAEEPEEEDTEAIQVIQEIDDQPATEKSQGPFCKLNDKFVIFKHRLAKSSLVVAVETSGRPKVRLITAKLRKFIDEEADELRWKRENQNQSQIWYQKALYHLFDWLSSESKPTSGPECEQETESKFEQVRDCPQSAQNQVNTEHEKTKSNLQPKARLERTLAATNKLSPSPIFPDGCSSLSGCSLLSPSPTIEQHQAPICNCPLMAGPKWDAGFGQVQSTARSRSQGHSPCQLGALNQLNEPFRPCCSASPSVFKAQPQRQVCNQLFQQQQQQVLVPTRHQQMMQHRCDLIARKPSFERPTTTTCDASRNHYSTLAKCGAHNHIKRQYENYYDEERGDAYCRLTASFGMDAQEACGRDPAAADASLLSLEYSTCNSGQPGLAHCNGLPANHAMGGQCDRVSSMGAFQTQLATNPNSEPLCKCCHRPEPNQGFYGQQVVPPPFDQQCQFKWAGSVSEPQSSASTSLGGSDSGFVVSNAGSNLIYQPPAVCRDPSCACQPQTACPSMPAPPMSILVQQPSIATPPPPPAARESPSVEPVNGDSEKANQPDEKANEPAKKEATKQMEKPAKRCPPPLGPAAVRKSCSASGRPRWKHRRRLSQRRRTDLTPPSAPLCRPTGVQQLDGSRQASYQSRGPPPPRRMSIAGDQVYPSRAVLARDSLSSGTGSCRPAPSAALMHRASIAGPDGAWSQSPLWYGSRSGPRGQQQPGSHLGSPAHRPSDASLYEGILLAGSQCCSASSSTASVLNSGQLTMAGGKIAACSAYSSSSGGSSSGIGITGSACTNTPTSTHLPYGGSFASAQENDGCPPDVQPMCPGGYHRHHQSGRHHHYHQHAAHYAHMAVHHGAQLTGDSICQAPACPSRKYSLPVQLEASAATCSPSALERLSPNQQLIGQTRESQRPSRFLFEKNLQRVDSIGTPIGEVPGSASSRHQQPFGDSRRSSQTVTRQSSFWLEDNSLDMSIISSLATSGLGDAPASDEEPTNNCLPGAEQSQGIYGQPAESHNQQPAVSSQRPSISSLILSADSIESVKQRPPVEPKDEANQAPGIQESSSSSFENHSVRPDTLSSNLPANKGSPSTKGCTTRVGRCNRLSSSSTSSSTSSPSPDFSRPSERILALAPNSSSISKRHLFGRLRSRSTRYLRTGGPGSHQDRRPPALSAIVHQHSAPDATSSTSGSAGRNGEPDEAEEAAKSDGCPTTPLLDSGSALLASKSSEVNVDFKSNAPSERPIVDLNSTSLERQCRELWKLRATLHEDSCVGQDDWSNYHQRLNRRYDSGYKSIENQLSSSLENNHLSASMNVAAAAAAAAATQGSPRDSSSQARPPSGCSGVRPQSCEPERGKIYRRPTSADAVAQIKLELANTGQPFSLDLDGQPVDHVSSAGKLVELDTRLDSASNGDLMLLGASSNEALDHESCQSRSSNGEPDSSNQDLGSPPPNTRGHETT